MRRIVTAVRLTAELFSCARRAATLNFGVVRLRTQPAMPAPPDRPTLQREEHHMDVKRVERPAAASEHRSDRGVGAADGAGGATAVEPLEARRLFAVSIALEALVNASKLPANQSETAVAFDRNNPNRIFVSSNHGAFREPDQGPNDPIAEQGIFVSNSLDGGATWSPRVMA